MTVADNDAGLLSPRTVVRLAASERPILIVVVDTEEEFDWSKPVDRNETSVSSMRHIGRVQEIFDQYRIRPCYVIDYPVAAQEEGYLPLRRFLESDRCCIGAHLHPWVNPPHDEAVCDFNSFPGNLDCDLERRKLELLSERIRDAFGIDARIYKAGRYGIGPNTARILEELGFDIDLSPACAFDYSAQGGPNFEEHPNDPYWFGAERDRLCAPCSGALVGWWHFAKRALYNFTSQPALRDMHLPGMLARLRMVERIRLSPEGYTLAEMIRLTRYLIAREVRVLTLSFHSPSVQPGCSPYVRDQDQLQRFLGSLRGYFDFFLGDLKGRPMTPLEVRRYLRTVPTRSVELPPALGRVWSSSPS